MSSHPLSSIEWHDLPVLSIRIGEAGLSLVVAPYNDATTSYDQRVLSLTEADSVSLKIEGTLTAKDLSSLEVASFDYSMQAERITGKLGLLPGKAGFWELSFVNARWDLADA